MYVDRDFALGLKLDPIHVDIERGRHRLFAKAIGETNPIYFDLEAARAAGHPDLLAPPSYLGNAIELDIDDPLAWMKAVGIDITSTLHGGQSIEFFAQVHAGDHLTLNRSIVDVTVKKAGALEFVTKRSEILRGEERVAVALCTIAVLHPEAGK